MPTRSLNSSVLKWPDKETIVKAVENWSKQILLKHTEVNRIGFFGSYARGNWGVGSDLDLVLIVEASADAFKRRATRWDTLGLPVPVDLLVYTRAEWARLATRPRDVVWLAGTPP